MDDRSRTVPKLKMRLSKGFMHFNLYGMHKNCAMHQRGRSINMRKTVKIIQASPISHDCLPWK
jgi:hypothetical protein